MGEKYWCDACGKECESLDNTWLGFDRVYLCKSHKRELNNLVRDWVYYKKTGKKRGIINEASVKQFLGISGD